MSDLPLCNLSALFYAGFASLSSMSAIGLCPDAILRNAFDKSVYDFFSS